MLSPEIPRSEYPLWNGADISEARSETYSFGLGAYYYERTEHGEYISQTGIIISSNKKDAVVKKMMSFADVWREKEILEYALRSLLKMNRLSAEYASLLEESLSDEMYGSLMQEYEEIAKEYAYEPRHILPSEIVKGAKVILDAVGEELSSDEIADMLELEVMDVERALQKYSRRCAEFATIPEKAKD